MQYKTTRPVWVSGHFASPYSTAINFDNLVLVASGIGITPALSVVAAHRATRRVNLVWVCREPSLVEFYLSKFQFPTNALTLIYYTGKGRKLVLENIDLPRTVLVLEGRPKLGRTVRLPQTLNPKPYTLHPTP